MLLTAGKKLEDIFAVEQAYVKTKQICSEYSVGEAKSGVDFSVTLLLLCKGFSHQPLPPIGVVFPQETDN
ncbi:MAG TPA: hypothetical protein V6D25_15965 [Leptolyngbyaceae cyanobacterium]